MDAGSKAEERCGIEPVEHQHGTYPVEDRSGAARGEVPAAVRRRGGGVARGGARGRSSALWITIVSIQGNEIINGKIN